MSYNAVEKCFSAKHIVHLFNYYSYHTCDKEKKILQLPSSCTFILSCNELESRLTYFEIFSNCFRIKRRYF